MGAAGGTKAPRSVSESAEAGIFAPGVADADGIGEPHPPQYAEASGLNAPHLAQIMRVLRTFLSKEMFHGYSKCSIAYEPIITVREKDTKGKIYNAIGAKTS